MKIFFTASIIILTFLPLLSFAQTPTIVDVSFPGTTPTTNLPQYIKNLYQFGIAIAGILAVGAIVVGAIYISVSGGSPDKQSEGKDMITQALWGLLLLFGSYLILRTINPEIVLLKSPHKPADEQERIYAACINATTVGNANLKIGETKTTKIDDKEWLVVPFCSPGFPPINPTTNGCQCLPKEEETVECPADVKPLLGQKEEYDYSWVTGGREPGGGVAGQPKIPVSQTGVKGCPKRVRIGADVTARRYTIYAPDCDTCAEGWSSANDSKSFDRETAGWLWPYYPAGGKKLGEVTPSGDPTMVNVSRVTGARDILPKPEAAKCILYAYRDPEDGKIVRSDLDGTKPCHKFKKE